MEDRPAADGAKATEKPKPGKHMLTGVSGRLGSAVLQAILDYKLLPPTDLLISTSSDPNDYKWNALKVKGIEVRHACHEDIPGMVKAFQGVWKILLISSPHIELDLPGQEETGGREKLHLNAIQACQAAGVKHIYYTSLGLTPVKPFGPMAEPYKAHDRTEHTLRVLVDMHWTIIREAPYAQMWPLYFGFHEGTYDKRQEILVTDDGPVSWTAVEDLGLGTASIFTDHCESWCGLTVTLSSQDEVSLNRIAEIVSKAKKVPVKLKIVPEEEYIRYYKGQRGMGESLLKWWVTTYPALKRGEACHRYEPTLREILKKQGREIKLVEEIIRYMVTQRDAGYVSGPVGPKGEGITTQ